MDGFWAGSAELKAEFEAIFLTLAQKEGVATAKRSRFYATRV